MKEMKERNATPVSQAAIQDQEGNRGVWLQQPASMLTRQLQNRIGNRILTDSVSGAEPSGFGQVVAGEMFLAAGGVGGAIFSSNAAVCRAMRALSGSEAGAVLDVAGIQALIRRSRGALLPSAVASRFSSAMGHDFSGVRVHTDAPASEAAHQLNARAFAQGQDIYFARNHYQPDTREGQALLGHELTHVIQHDEGRLANPSGGFHVSSPTDPVEREASAVEARIHTDLVQVDRSESPENTATGEGIEPSSAPVLRKDGKDKKPAKNSADPQRQVLDRIVSILSVPPKTIRKAKRNATRVRKLLQQEGLDKVALATAYQARAQRALSDDIVAYLTLPGIDPEDALRRTRAYVLRVFRNDIPPEMWDKLGPGRSRSSAQGADLRTKTDPAAEIPKIPSHVRDAREGDPLKAPQTSTAATDLDRPFGGDAVVTAYCTKLANEAAKRLLKRSRKKDVKKNRKAYVKKEEEALRDAARRQHEASGSRRKFRFRLGRKQKRALAKQASKEVKARSDEILLKEEAAGYLSGLEGDFDEWVPYIMARNYWPKRLGKKAGRKKRNERSLAIWPFPTKDKLKKDPDNSRKALLHYASLTPQTPFTPRQQKIVETIVQQRTTSRAFQRKMKSQRLNILAAQTLEDNAVQKAFSAAKEQASPKEKRVLEKRFHHHPGKLIKAIAKALRRAHADAGKARKGLVRSLQKSIGRKHTALIDAVLGATFTTTRLQEASTAGDTKNAAETERKAIRARWVAWIKGNQALLQSYKNGFMVKSREKLDFDTLDTGPRSRPRPPANKPDLRRNPAQFWPGSLPSLDAVVHKKLSPIAQLRKKRTPDVPFEQNRIQQSIVGFCDGLIHKGSLSHSGFKAAVSKHVHALIEPEGKKEKRAVSGLISSISKHRRKMVRTTVVSFLRKLHAAGLTFSAGSYPGHGGGAFDDQGYSVDITPRKRGPSDLRGFYNVNTMVSFFLKLHRVAQQNNLDWQALYNDYKVAGPVNRALGKRYIRFVKYHGPAPYVLHVHLDIAPRGG